MEMEKNIKSLFVGLVAIICLTRAAEAIGCPEGNFKWRVHNKLNYSISGFVRAIPMTLNPDDHRAGRVSLEFVNLPPGDATQPVCTLRSGDLSSMGLGDDVWTNWRVVLIPHGTDDRIFYLSGFQPCNPYAIDVEKAENGVIDVTFITDKPGNQGGGFYKMDIKLYSGTCYSPRGSFQIRTGDINQDYDVLFNHTGEYVSQGSYQASKHWVMHKYGF
jgi:hypothetical protein